MPRSSSRSTAHGHHASIAFRYRVWRAADATRDRALAADGKVVCAVTDLARMVAIPIPERVRALLIDLVEPGPDA